MELGGFPPQTALQSPLYMTADDSKLYLREHYGGCQNFFSVSAIGARYFHKRKRPDSPLKREYKSEWLISHPSVKKNVQALHTFVYIFELPACH